MKLTKFGQVTAIATAALLLAPTTSFAATFRAAGADAAAIQGTVDAFRAELGDLNPNVAGSFADGRRQIDWDAVPDRFAAPNNLPPDFFNVNTPRGAVFNTPGSGVQVSGNAGVAPIEFDNINPTYSSNFTTFSPQRLFTAIDSNIVDVNFFVPGSNIAAAVDGFGAVFTDVDLAGITKIDYFGLNGELLTSEFVDAVPNSDESLSFLGVSFDDFVVSRVRITSGNSALGPNDDPANGVDIVVMDDFIYGEPQAANVPEPSSTLGLLLGGVLPLAGWIRKRRSSSAA